MFRLAFLPLRMQSRVPSKQILQRTFHARNRLLNVADTAKKASETAKQAAETAQQSAPKKASKTGTIKELTKKYGWTAVGVYFVMSALDLPVAYMIVHSLGKEKVQSIEKAVKGFFGMSTKPEDLATVETEENSEGKTVAVEDQTEKSTQWSLFLTEFTLAYAIHKSVFLLFRIPATAAVTPWAVKTLQKWGFKVGTNASKFGTPPTKGQKVGGFFF